ncbi:hypothetical protein BH10PSE14_BH10PSE14_22310 [soil metagenome]
MTVGACNVEVAAGAFGADDRHAATLGHLGDLLARSGYGEFVGHFDPLSPDPQRWRSYASNASPALKPLLDLFLLNGEVAADGLPPELRALLPTLIELGLVTGARDGMLGLGGLVLLAVLGTWLFCDPPQADADFYLGEDSMALLTRMTPVAGGETLDLCAGPGLHALHAARFSRRVVAVERDATAARLARINADLNRLGDRVLVLQGDLYAPIAGQRFDNITANPPWLPYPPGLRSPAIGDGGSDGLRLVRRILAGLAPVLKDGGAAQVVGMTWSDGRLPLACDELAALSASSGLDLRVTTLSHIALDGSAAFAGRWLRALCAVSGETVATCHAAMTGLIADARATHLCAFFLCARPGRERFEAIDLTGAPRFSAWHL